MGLLQQFIAMKRYILKPVSLGYANRVYVEQLTTVTPISDSRRLYETRSRRRTQQAVVVPDLDVPMTLAGYNSNRYNASKINNRQAVDNVNLIVPKVNEESRLGTGDDEYEYT